MLGESEAVAAPVSHTLAVRAARAGSHFPGTAANSSGGERARERAAAADSAPRGAFH